MVILPKDSLHIHRGIHVNGLLWHPCYETGLNPEPCELEKTCLEGIVDSSITGCTNECTSYFATTAVYLFLLYYRCGHSVVSMNSWESYMNMPYSACEMCVKFLHLFWVLTVNLDIFAYRAPFEPCWNPHCHILHYEENMSLWQYYLPISICLFLFICVQNCYRNHKIVVSAAKELMNLDYSALDNLM